MKTERLFLFLLAGAALAPSLSATRSVSTPSVPVQPVTLTVHVDRPGPLVSPSLYGVFFEEINHAGEGGLYAERVRNRDFEEMGPTDGQPAGWSIRTGGEAKGSMALDTARPLNDAHPRSLRLDVTDVPSGRVGVVNEGYWGIPVRKGASYRLSLYARRSADRGGPLAVSLEGGGGQVYASAVIEGLSENWHRFACRLTANAGDPTARLVLSTTTPGSVWLNVVSLFPATTWKQRPNGLRVDLAGRVNALHPAFVRFPGGCYVEGNHLANAFQWKQTLGSIAGRPGHRNDNWGYWSTDGLGFHEYLQMCEDIGATPLFVVNCGIAHHDVVPMDQLQPWIQDALDAIEYANGPVTSRWGAVRARNGHPAPFGLRYLEIGNENGLFGRFGGTREQYAERYQAFYQAIKARYPDLQLIADTRVPAPMDLVDEHFYNGPGWFWANTDHYDHYNRSGPRIYVGEYAVTQGCGRGNLRAALAEAAFMTGLERNSDIVRMASYAPLFVNVHDRRWNPDAIVFDAAQSYGTPSYYVQKLFAQNRADAVLPVEISSAPAPPAKGGIGLGTWRTQAEYKEIEVTQHGQTIYRSDFAQGAPDWRPLRGDWKIVEGAYQQSAGENDRRAILAGAALEDASDYTIHLKARKLGGAEGFLILFHARDENNYTWWNIGGWGNHEHALEKSAGGGTIELGSHVPGSIETGRWYDIRIELAGPRIRCYLDDQLIHDVQDRPVPTLAAVAGTAEKGREIIIKAVNGAETPLEATIRLEGAGSLGSTGQAITLTSSSMDDENSLAQPAKVAPASRSISGIALRFTFTFPARSVTVLRLKRKQEEAWKRLR
jgi:alpha-L-arabinofuranosidase